MYAQVGIYLKLKYIKLDNQDRRTVTKIGSKSGISIQNYN